LPSSAVTRVSRPAESYWKAVSRPSGSVIRVGRLSATSETIVVIGSGPFGSTWVTVIVATLPATDRA
jgi:hypothetical protein